MIPGRIVRDGGATVLPREFKDEAEIAQLRERGFHVELDAEPAVESDSTPEAPAAKKPAKKKAAA